MRASIGVAEASTALKGRPDGLDVKSYAVEDPAFRDVDEAAWRSGRFAERVRRAWNTVPSSDIEAAGGDIDALARAIHAREGGHFEEIRDRLVRFQQAEAEGAPTADPLVRPGAPV